jgi:hypothetical protein
MHFSLPLFAVSVLFVGCRGPGSDELTRLRDEHAGLSAAQIEASRPAFIDVACVVTPRPKMAEASGILEYDYAMSGSTLGLSPMEATITPEAVDPRETIVIKGVGWAAGATRQLTVGVRYKLKVAWNPADPNDRPKVEIWDHRDPASPVHVITEFLNKLGVQQLPWGLQVTYWQDALPHVVAWAESGTEQWLFVKTGSYWVKFVLTRGVLAMQA